ncbi:unnamed protein product, partial [Xyrichtys novacula]
MKKNAAKAQNCDDDDVTLAARSPPALPVERSMLIEKETEGADMFLPFHFFLQTQPGDTGGGMMVASTCPRSTIGLPAMSPMIYDAVKS